MKIIEKFYQTMLFAGMLLMVISLKWDDSAPIPPMVGCIIFIFGTLMLESKIDRLEKKVEELNKGKDGNAEPIKK